MWPWSYNNSEGQGDLHKHISSQNLEIPHSGIELCSEVSAFTVHNWGTEKSNAPCTSHCFTDLHSLIQTAFPLGELKNFDYWSNNKHWWGSEGSSCKLLPRIPLNERMEPKINSGEYCSVLGFTVATLSLLKLPFIKQQLPWSKENISILGVSNQVQRVFVSHLNWTRWHFWKTTLSFCVTWPP